MMYNEIDLEKFIKVWVEASKKGEGVQWVADKMGLDFSRTRNVKASLYGRGVKFPPLHKGTAKLTKKDVIELNKIIEREEK